MPRAFTQDELSRVRSVVQQHPDLSAVKLRSLVTKSLGKSIGMQVIYDQVKWVRGNPGVHLPPPASEPAASADDAGLLRAENERLKAIIKKIAMQLLAEVL